MSFWLMVSGRGFDSRRLHQFFTRLFFSLLTYIDHQVAFSLRSQRPERQGASALF